MAQNGCLCSENNIFITQTGKSSAYLPHTMPCVNAALIGTKASKELKERKLNIDIKDLKVILTALGFEPQEDEIKKLLSTINRSDEEDVNKKGFSSSTIDFHEFLKIMNNKLVRKNTFR